MPRKKAEHRNPVEIAFTTAQRLAAGSAAVRLIHAPLDLTQVEVLEGIEGTRAALRSAYRAGGKKHDQQEQWANAEAAYLYGLAVGVALGRGSVR
jgi:hypothetical protein